MCGHRRKGRKNGVEGGQEGPSVGTKEKVGQDLLYKSEVIRDSEYGRDGRNFEYCHIQKLPETNAFKDEADNVSSSKM